MKERLIQLLDLEQLTPSKFADIIGVQRSSISHVISGRNKPSYDFLQKTLKAFPGLNASWLLLGEGTMYEQMGRSVSGNLFDSPAEVRVRPEEPIYENKEPGTETEASEAVPERAQGSEDLESITSAQAPASVTEVTSGKRIVQVMLIYEDDTFKTITPTN
jgi:transcriptional regulator with XRE-family HTH domain